MSTSELPTQAPERPDDIEAVPVRHPWRWVGAIVVLLIAASIVRSIVELGHRLGYRVTAEGVNDQATLDYLAEIGCDHAQGFFIARALPPETLAALLARPLRVGESIA